MEKNNASAVEWLLKEQFNLMMDNDKLSKKQYLGRRFQIEKKAKQIERDQMFREFINGVMLGSKTDKKELQKYYDKIYKEKKK